MPRRSPALVLSAAAALAAAVVLAGCSTPGPAPSSAPPSPSDTATATPEPTDTAAPAEPTPVDIPCAELVPSQTMYDFNPNFSLIDPWTPSSGSPAADAVAAEGVACRWQNDTSGEVIDVSVAALDATALEERANDAYTHSTMVPTYGGDEGYFAVTDGVGEAIVFQGEHWVVVSSSYFLEPGDAEPIVAAVLAAL